MVENIYIIPIYCKVTHFQSKECIVQMHIFVKTEQKLKKDNGSSQLGITVA